MAQFYEDYWKEKIADTLDDFSYKWPVVKKILPKEGSLVILDYGCGAGKILQKLIQMSPNNIFIGVDVSKKAIKRAKKRNPKAKFLLTSDGRKIPLKDSSVDYIVILDVIEHIYDTKKAFSEFARVLKKNGKILISTPYHGLIKNLLISIYGFEKVFDPVGPHIRFFTVNSLRKCMENENLKVIKTGFFGRFYPLSRGFFLLCAK